MKAIAPEHGNRGRSPRFVWRALRTMTWPDRAELLRIVVLAAACEAVIRSLPLDALAKGFRVGLTADAGVVSPDQRDELPSWAKRRCRMVVRVMGHWPVDGACLRQSLVLGQRLRRLDPVLQIGVRRNAGNVEAHAWITVGGLTLDSSAWAYEPFPNLA